MLCTLVNLKNLDIPLSFPFHGKLPRNGSVTQEASIAEIDSFRGRTFRAGLDRLYTMTTAVNPDLPAVGVVPDGSGSSLGTGTVGTTALAAGAVTAAKLADAVGLLIPGTTTTITPAPQAGDDRIVTVQLVDAKGNNVARKTNILISLSDVAGDDLTATAPDGGVVFGTGKVLLPLSSGKMWCVDTDATGKVIFTVTESGTKTFYVNVIAGGLIVSAALAFV